MIITRDRVLEVLSRHVGKAQGVRVDRLAMEITGETTRNPSAERRVRGHVKKMRDEGSHICAHPKTGYFMATDDEELRHYYTNFMRKRAMTTLRQISRAEKVALPELLGQLRLET